MWRATFVTALLAAALTCAQSEACRAQDQLKVAVGGRGIGETFVTEVGYKAGLFNKHNLVLDIFYTDGGGETQQAVISNSAQIGVASGFLGAIGVFAKGAPVRIIGGSYTGGAQVFWYVPAGSPIRTPQDLEGKTVAYSNNGSSTHAGVLALQKHYRLNFDKQTSRVIIANANELKARPDVFTRFMRGYRDSLAWIYSSPEGLKAYAAFAKLSEATARRALQEFLPAAAVDPDRISGLEEVMADAISFKFIAKPLTRDELAELIQIPERRQ
jgi:NitT/TauT family transport system substrate-binding protein